MIKELVIKSGQGDYNVYFFNELSDFLESITFEKADYFVLIDQKVLEIYQDRLRSIKDYPTYTISAIEESKTLQQVSDLSYWLAENGATKSSKILAIGGGIIQDIATFTSHIYKRGISWEYLPTTLLSQSDSCIGAKCGINLMPNKNQLGVMHSPNRVWIVSEFLKSLETKVFCSGYGEILKLSLTQPHQFYGTFKEVIATQGFDIESSFHLTQLSLKAKQAVIEEDEYEKDLRRILNYGHSFGHALESVTHNSVDHGFAVLFGIDIINFLSVKWGYLETKDREDIRKTISDNFTTNFLPRKITADELINAIKSDKKVSGGKMHFAILNQNCKLQIIAVPIDEKLKSEVEEYLSNDSIFTTA